MAYIFILFVFIFPSALLIALNIPNSIGISLFLLSLGYLAFLLKVRPNSRVSILIKNAF